jgi:nicotinamidase-related amidase
MLNELDPRVTALVLIDLQNWTLGMPITPHPASAVVGNASRLARSLKASGGTIILTRADFSAGYADALRQPVDIPLPLPEGGLPREAVALSQAFDVEPEAVITSASGAPSMAPNSTCSFGAGASPPRSWAG